ncbi:MAG: tandem-95 repeat protein [Cyclobacteriaceae bacterium]
MDDNVGKSTLSIDGTTATYTGTIEAADHPFIFSGENVFIFVDVITANGFISSASYIYNSGSGGRIEASPDGLFFAFGNQLAVRENATAQLKLQAVELGDFSLTGAAVEVITPPENGSLGVATLASVEERILTWELPYTGTREVGGSDSVQFRIYHPDRQLFDTAWVQINVVDVNDQPTITAITDQQMEEDEVLSLNVDIEDPDSQLEIISTSNEASSVPVSYDRGVLTVTPKEDFFGSVSISIVAQEVGTAEQFLGYEQFDLEIIPVNDAPVVTAVNDQSIDEDQSLQIVLSATDADNANAVFVFEASSNAPSSVKTSVLGSTLSIVPEANVFGDFEVSVTANDQSGTATALSAPVNFTVSIAAVNDAPEITKTIETQNLIANFPSYDIDLSAFFTDIESGDELTYQFAGNSQVLLDVSEQILTVSLTQGFTGVEDVTITASDGSLSVSQSVTFVVTEASTDVSISSPVADLQLLEDFDAFTLDVSNVFTSSASGAIFSYQLIGNSFILPLISDDEQTITFSPTADFNGTEKMILLGTANGKTAFDEFEIVVSPVNDAPVLTAIEDVTINEDQALSNLFIEATDIDNVELSLALVSSDETLVKNSSISVSTLEGGFLVGLSPEADKNGSVDLYVTLSDGTLEQQDTFNIEVKPINDAPMITSVSAPGAIEDQLYQLELSDFFSEPDGESFTVTVTQKPLWMTVGQGTISGTPENEDVGDWSIRLKASDTSQNSVQRVLDFTVENVNDAPIINQPLADIQVLQGSAWSYSLPSASFEDIDADDVLTLSFDRKPSWTSVSDGSLVGTPAYEDIGSSEVIVSATDQAGATIMDTFSVEVIFTDYEVEISISELMICLGLEGTVAAEGAFDYNWYEADSLIQDGGDALTYVFREGVQYFVKGKDEQGRTTASRFLVPIELIAGPEIEVTASGDRLSVTTQDSNLSFQWYDSEGAIEGATGATFNATGSGDYYVIATNEAGCFTASESINYILSLNDLSRINMYPNPAIDVVNLTDVPIGATIQILELSGRTMHEYSKNRDTSIQLDVSGYKPGVYFLKITNEHSNQIFKLIKH